MESFVRKFFFPVFILLLLLQGCVAVQSFPVAARAGDTITLAVGSPEGMTKSNTTVSFISDVDASVTDLPVRSIIRIRPDQTSEAALFDISLNALDYHTGHSQWMTLIVIDLPENITVGTGVINIVSSASYGSLAQGINDIPVSLEILEGTGASNDFSFNNNFGSVSPYSISRLEPLPQAVFQLPGSGSNLYNFAAAEIKVNVPVGSVQDSYIRVVADDFYTKNPRGQVQMNWSRNGDEFTVNFISPRGTMKLKQLRFSIVLRPGENFVTQPEPRVVSVQLYDKNGYLIPLSELSLDTGMFVIGVQ